MEKVWNLDLENGVSESNENVVVELRRSRQNSELGDKGEKRLSDCIDFGAYILTHACILEILGTHSIFFFYHC